MKFLLLVLIVLLAVPAFAQSWGEGPFDFYNNTQRSGTYDERVVGSEVTYISSTDTFYTELMAIGEVDGVYKVELSADSSDAPSDSLYLDVAFYDTKRANSARWTPWYNIFGPIHTDTLYQLYIDPNDSTWWVPNMSRQYRVYRRDVADDSLTLFLNDFIR